MKARSSTSARESDGFVRKQKPWPQAGARLRGSAAIAFSLCAVRQTGMLALAMFAIAVCALLPPTARAESRSEVCQRYAKQTRDSLFQARAAASASAQEVNAAATRVEQMESLAAAGAVSQQQVQRARDRLTDAQNALKTARSQERAAQAQLKRLQTMPECSI